MDIIQATMPRVTQRGGDVGKGPGAVNVNLAALSQFAKSMKARNMAHVWRGRRTGLMIDDAQVTKDRDGLDNIESFWESARLDGGASTPGTASIEPSTPGSEGSPLGSPESAASTRWTRPGMLEAATGGSHEALSDRKEGSDMEGNGIVEEDGDEEGVHSLVKRLDFPPTKTMPSPGLSRSEISTDEEVADNDDGRDDEGEANGSINNNTKASARKSRGSTGGAAAPAHGSSDALDAADAAAGQAGDSPALVVTAALSAVNPAAENSRIVARASKTPVVRKGRPKVAGSTSKKRTSTPVASTRTTRASSGGGRANAGASGLATRSGGRHSIGSLVSQDALTDQDFGNGGGDGGVSSSDDEGDGGGGWDDMGFGVEDSDNSDTVSEQPKAKSPTKTKLIGETSPPKTSPKTPASPATRSSSRKRPATTTPAPSSPASNRRTGGSTSAEEVVGRAVAASSPAVIAEESKEKKGLTTRNILSPSSRPTSPLKSPQSKGKGKGKGPGNVGNHKDDGDDDDDQGDGFAGNMEAFDDNDDDEAGVGGVELSPPTPSSPVMRGRTRSKSDADDNAKDSAAVAVKKTVRRKRNSDEPIARRKAKGVVARLSVGGPGARGGSDEKGKGRRSQAAAPTTPGPPRAKNASRFVEMSEVAEVSNTPGVRRSGRQRVAPLKFWKGDNIQYQVDEEGLPVAKGIVKGPSTTPAPSRKRARAEGGGGSKKRDRGSLEPMSPSQLSGLPGRAKYMQKEEECVVWDEDSATNIRRHVVMRANNLVNHNLTATLDRPPGKDKVGAAAQAFNVPAEVGISEWLSGRLQLPPEAIKDSEHVAHSTQIYIVGEGQRNALELAIALPTNEVNSNIFDPATAQRFLLSPGDHFYVPVNNVYRLENHSKKATAVIYWAILKDSSYLEDAVSVSRKMWVWSMK